MNVEVLIQSFKLGEKQAIIQALTELIDFLVQGSKAQEEIIQFLPENNIMMIIDYLSDPDPYLRRLTAKFLLDLLHGNYLVQLVFCDILGMMPFDGKICLNNVPDSFKNAARHLPDCLEALKHASEEEKNEHLPYCWYLHVQNADKAEKKITYVPSFDRESLLDCHELFDPLHAIIGFVMRSPKQKESNTKVLKSKLSDIVKPITTQTSVELGPLNVSSDQVSHLKTNMTDSQISQKATVNLNVSAKRKPLIKNPVVGLPHISSKSTTKPNVNLTMLTPTSSNQKSEKGHNKTTLIGPDCIEEVNSGSSTEKKIITRVVFKKMADDRKLGTRNTEPTIDLFEGTQTSKLNASINDAHDEPKTATIENSLNNSLVMKGKTITVATTPTVINNKVKSQSFKNPKTTKTVTSNEKTQTFREKELSSILTTDEMNLSQQGKQKSTELDKKLPIKTPKGSVNSHSSTSNKAAPNTTLLNKILKAKPATNKEKSHTMSTSVQKTDQNKGSFWDFIYAYRKINANTLSSVVTSTNKSTKTPTITPLKKEDLQQSQSKSSSTTQTRKRAMHTSLIQQNIEANTSLSNRYEAIDDELSLDMTPKETLHSSRKTTVPLKNYHISGSFKNPVSTSRASQEAKKEAVTTFGKFLSPRKSHDATYLGNHKKKADISHSGQESKSIKKTSKKVSQTLTTDSPRVK